MAKITACDICFEDQERVAGQGIFTNVAPAIHRITMESPVGVAATQQFPEVGVDTCGEHRERTLDWVLSVARSTLRPGCPVQVSMESV